MAHLRALLIALPLAQLPGVPNLPLPVDVGKPVGEIVGRLPERPLAELRRLQIDELLRTRRKLIEPDPAGEPMVRSEVLAFSPSEDALRVAQAVGFTIARERVLAGLDARVIVLRAPSRMSTRRALAKLRELDPQGTYDFNHIYTGGGEVAESGAAKAAQVKVAVTPAAVPPQPSESETTSPVASADASGARPRIGLVDGGVDSGHPVFADVVVHRHGCGDRVVPSAHGTAVASLIAGHAGKFHGAAPGAELYAADIYCDRPTGGAMDDIADAIAWIVGERVPVINVSLVGPKNGLLESVVRAASAKGHLIVAAVGNDGPAARPLYPAAYPGVVGVTAVDVKQRVLLEACRGPHVDFAAPGADMAAAVVPQTYAQVRGTSFAAPLVASLLAGSLHEPNAAAAQNAVTSLAQVAVDLGEKGVDVVYGNGLVGEALRIDPSLASAGK